MYMRPIYSDLRVTLGFKNHTTPRRHVLKSKSTHPVYLTRPKYRFQLVHDSHVISEQRAWANGAC